MREREHPRWSYRLPPPVVVVSVRAGWDSLGAALPGDQVLARAAGGGGRPAAAVVRCAVPGRLRCPASHGPVALPGARATSLGVPAVRMRPPSGPPPVPCR